jgi:protein TonB
VVSASSLKTLHREAPVYPPQALQNLTSGWVELEYTVTTEGSVRDVVVVASQPRRTFDSAAVAAIRRYRYQPVLRNGVPVEQRATLRMRFTAEDGRR